MSTPFNVHAMPVVKLSQLVDRDVYIAILRNTNVAKPTSSLVEHALVPPARCLDHITTCLSQWDHIISHVNAKFASLPYGIMIDVLN